MYAVTNATWTPEIIGWADDVSRTKSLSFGSTNDVGLFCGTLTVWSDGIAMQPSLSHITTESQWRSMMLAVGGDY